MPDVARTLDLPPDQRFDYWKHVLSDTFVPLRCPARAVKATSAAGSAAVSSAACG